MDVQIPALAPGERVSVEAVLDGIDAVMENRHQVDLELEPAAGQADLSETFAVLRFTFDSSGTWAQQAYMQLPGENLIADAPWRSILDSIPVLVFYARVTWLQDIKPGWGKKMAWTPILMKNVVIRNPNGPLSGQGNVIYLDWYHIAPLFLPAGATSWDEFGQEVPGGDVVWTLSPDDGAHRVLWIPKAGLVKSCAGLPDPGMCGYYLEVKFNYLKLQVQTWVEGYTRRMLGVEDGSGMLPKFDAADHYFDAHYHTIAEWYRKGELLGPSKAYGGPLWMMTAHLASIGVLDSPKLENVSGKIITTDHNTFFDDLDAPEAGPTSFWEWGNAPAATNSAEMDIYRSIFGQTAGEEVTTDGDTLEPLDTALGRHILTYMSKHVNGSWGWLGAAGWAGGLCTPSYDNLIRRIACNPGQASDCEGDGSGEQCIGGNPDDPQGFIFPAHPLAGGFKWSDSALRHMFSLKSPPWSPLTLDKNNRDYLTAKENAGDKGDFVVRGYQLWNTRVAQEVSSGLFTGTLRDINPYPGAVMDKPGKKWKTWTPHCDGYRASVKEAAVNLLTLARDGANYFFKDDEKPRIWFIRKVFHVAGSDAHGDFGYGTDICATKALGLTTKLGLSGVSDNAMGRPNTYVFGGTLEDLKHGRSTATDGPILELLIDPESRGSYDQETGSITWHDKEDKFEDADGRMGGDGFRDGMRTALVPVLYSEKASQRVIARLRCTNIADLGGGNVKKAELLVSGQGSTSEEPKTILLEGFECNGSYKDYVIPVGYTQEDPTATLSQPVAVMAHVQIGDACPGTYDAYTNPVWLAPMNGVITVQAVKTNANSLYLKMEQELSASFSIDVVFRMTMASQKVQARIMQIDAATGNLIKMTGGEDGEGGLILQGGLDQGWGNSPKGGDPGDTLRNRLSLRIPYNKYIYGPLTAAKLEDERFVLVVSRVPSESDVAPCNDARLCDTFGNPLGIVMLRFKPMSTCQQKSCPSDYKWCKSLCQCAMAYMCPIGSMYFGGCECCMSYDPWWLQCVYCAPKESVFYKFCPNG
ncbi:MAG: hypothetical protein FJ109_07130 [Deltaproteobacteria bacterium]|nr:hypothetical protein [Deltaproteobacteria bacterium]